MIFVEPSVTPVNEPDLTKKIERCFRICYQSEDKMTDSDTFIKSIINKEGKNKHWSPLEHGRICLKVDGRIAAALADWETARCTRFLKIDYDYKDAQGAYIIRVTGNFRTFREFITAFDPDFDKSRNDLTERAVAQLMISIELNKYFPALINKIENFPEGVIPNTKMFHICCQYLGEADDYQTFRVVTSRDMLQQLARHRSHSFSVESTKFINYTKKQGFTFCIPRPAPWADVDWNKINSYHPDSIDFENPMIEIFVKHAHDCCEKYEKLISLGLKAQEARQVLPGFYKTELFLSGTISGWKNFLSLRNDSHADPKIQILAVEMEKYLREHKPEWFK